MEVAVRRAGRPGAPGEERPLFRLWLSAHTLLFLALSLCLCCALNPGSLSSLPRAWGCISGRPLDISVCVVQPQGANSSLPLPKQAAAFVFPVLSTDATICLTGRLETWHSRSLPLTKAYPVAKDKPPVLPVSILSCPHCYCLNCHHHQLCGFLHLLTLLFVTFCYLMKQGKRRRRSSLTASTCLL